MRAIIKITKQFKSNKKKFENVYSVRLFDFSSFLPKRLDSQNLKQSIGNFGCLPVWVKKSRNRKNSRCIIVWCFFSALVTRLKCGERKDFWFIYFENRTHWLVINPQKTPYNNRHSQTFCLLVLNCFVNFIIDRI